MSIGKFIIAVAIAASAFVPAISAFADAYNAGRNSCINLAKTETNLKNVIASFRDKPNWDPGKLVYEMYAVADKAYGPSFSENLKKIAPNDFETPAGRHETAEDIAAMTLAFERGIALLSLKIAKSTDPKSLSTSG